MALSPYIARLRAHVGTDLLLLPSVSAVVRDHTARLLLARRSDNNRVEVAWFHLDALPALDDRARLRISTGLHPADPTWYAEPGETHPGLTQPDNL
jgi:hypothetical protein